MSETNEEKGAYAAGLVDGEGCFDIMKRGDEARDWWTARIRIGITNEPTIKWLQDNFGGSIYSWVLPSGKTMFQWAIYGKEVEKFLSSHVLSHLKIKKRHAFIVLNFLYLRYAEGAEKFYLELKALNKAGKDNSKKG